MKYGFYNKSDSTKELIDSKEFRDFGDAINFFAAMKGLPVDKFLEIFAVTVVKQSKNG